MKKMVILLFLTFIYANIFPQQNNFFMQLSKKDIATFNDGITLMRLLFNERDDESTYIENVLWAVEKKLFKVTLPIKDDQFNPLLNRSTFALWVCRIYTGKKGLVNNPKIFRLSAFKTLVNLGIMSEGRGAFDSFTGSELLDTFAYIDYYVRAYKIETNKGILEPIQDDYDNIPEWRARLYREVEEQHKTEKAEMDKAKKERIEKKKEKKIEKKEKKKSEVKIEE